MNNKHLACLVLVILCVLLVQGVSVMRKRATDMQGRAESARLEAQNAVGALDSQRAVFEDLKKKSADLLAWLDEWEPHLTRLSTAEASEIEVSSMLKQENLVLLAQRFETIANQGESAAPGSANATIPKIVRAHLSIEDDFIKSVNWLGRMQTQLPVARVSNLEMARGQTGNDLRMNVVVDIPLAVPRATPAPATAAATP